MAQLVKQISQLVKGLNAHFLQEHNAPNQFGPCKLPQIGTANELQKARKQGIELSRA